MYWSISLDVEPFKSEDQKFIVYSGRKYRFCGIRMPRSWAFFLFKILALHKS